MDAVIGWENTALVNRNDPESWVVTPPELEVERRALRSLARRTDRPALARLGLFIAVIAALGMLYAWSWGSWPAIPALVAFGGATSLTVYALSHECAHGTAFRTRWLNEAVFWATSFLYGHELLYLRYSHTSHHSFTMYVGHDAQVPFAQPVAYAAYLRLYTGVAHHFEILKLLISHARGRFSEETLSFVPEAELPRMRRSSQLFVTAYAGLAIGSLLFWTPVVLMYWILPKLAGDPLAMLYIGTQHFEMAESRSDLRETT